MNKIKKTFYIPVDESLTREDVEKQIKKLLNSYDEFDITWEFDPKQIAKEKRAEREKKIKRLLDD